MQSQQDFYLRGIPDFVHFELAHKHTLRYTHTHSHSHTYTHTLFLMAFFACSFHRFSLASGLHPDWMLTLFFVHTHLTVTVTLGLMFVPKVTIAHH